MNTHRPLRARWWAALALLPWMSLALGAAPSQQELKEGWRFRLAGDELVAQHPEARTWHSAQVPGSVHTDLLANGLIPDPFAGAAEASLQWVGLADWEYCERFGLDEAARARAHHELVFEGLDTFADVSLNGTPLLTADNAFRTWRIPVDGRLRAESNELCVMLRSPIKRLLPTVLAMPHRLVGNYPSPYGDEPRDAMTQNFVRKSGYHYGWDWGPRYVTAGIWRRVSLESWDHLRLTGFHIQQDQLSAQDAALTAQAEIESDRAQTVHIVFEAHDPDGRAVTSQTLEARLSAGANPIAQPLRIAQPRRWWPNGYGAQDLYSFRVTVVDGGAVAASAERRTGLRSVELRRHTDPSGQGFTFAINGVEVFAKGANLIPFDAFPARVTLQQQERVLNAAHAAHMNMLRSWGGGYYESDALFDLADRLGLMIWQDFMFGGGVVPAYDPDFRASVLAEARDNLLRLRDHPSLVLWCGNNEEETAWKDWRLGANLAKADPELAQRVWQGYQQLFGHDLRAVVAELGGGVPYWSSSPSNDLDRKANDPARGDRHYWEVWGAPARPVSAYLSDTPRFMSEFGLQSWPSLRTIASFASPEDMRMDAPIIRAHQKFMAGEGNTRVLKYIREEYGEPKDFADFVYLSQVMQAEGIELAALHLRASRPRTMGALYWQLNDAWPGASWSSIDWYGRPKALQFHAQRFYGELAVAALRHHGRTQVTLINDGAEMLRGELHLQVLGFDGRVLRETLHPVTLSPRAVSVDATYRDAELLHGADPERSCAVFELRIPGRPSVRQIVYFDAARKLALPAPQLSAALNGEGGAYSLTLHADALAREVWVDFGSLDAEVTDNALTLLPGETRSLQVRSAAGLEELRRSLSVRSLYYPDALGMN